MPILALARTHEKYIISWPHLLLNTPGGLEVRCSDVFEVFLPIFSHLHELRTGCKRVESWGDERLELRRSMKLCCGPAWMKPMEGSSYASGITCIVEIGGSKQFTKG